MLHVTRKSSVVMVPSPSKLLEEEAAHWPTIFNTKLLHDLKTVVRSDPSGQTALLVEKIVYEGAEQLFLTRGIDPFVKARAISIWSQLKAQRQTLADEWAEAFK